MGRAVIEKIDPDYPQVMILNYEMNEWWDGGSRLLDGESVSCWMPLPEPPQIEQNRDL